MSKHYTKLVRVALIYGVACYLVFVGLSVLSGRFFPDHRSDDDLTQQLHWIVRVVAEKIAGLILMSFTAFFAARSCRTTWKVGVATAIAAALVFQLVTIAVYIVRFGVASYRTFNDFIYTISTAVMLAWLFGLFAVWKQYRHERYAV
jgi:ACR3 family arsenite efflux pump ArsB